MKCLLCNNNEANQTGAHIFTNSLVRNCVNVEGKTGRDDELMFGFSQSGEKDLYVGNTTNPEKIEEVLGKEMTDEEIKANNNEFVIDNIYCRDCEKLFGKVESPFTERVLNKIRNEGVYKFNAPDNVLIRLYFYIQIWRASSYKYDGWSLNDSELEEEFRQIIFEGCETYDTGISEELKSRIIKFPLVVNYLETSDDEKSSNLIFIPNKTHTHFLFLCDFVIELLPVKEGKEEYILEAYFGINNNLQKEHLNSMETEFIIRVIPNDERKKINYAIQKNEFAQDDISRLIDRVRSEYFEITGIRISQEKLLEFRDKYFDWEDVPLVQRTSEDRFYEILLEIIDD
ncbi:MAG: hypothetical protein JXQ93_04880 [Flavobacteriaceae bacterium]